MITEIERAALEQWYGAEEAPRMEALFASATPEAYNEAAKLDCPTFATFGSARRAAWVRYAAWAILGRARDARDAMPEV